MSKYREAMQSITAGEQAKRDSAERLSRRAAAAVARKNNLRTAFAVLGALLLIAASTAITAVFSPAHGGDGGGQTLRAGETYTEADGAMVFYGIKICPDEQTGGEYAVINGCLDYENFAVNADGILLYCTADDGLAFTFDAKKTAALSAADLHVDGASGEARGEALLAFTADGATFARLRELCSSAPDAQMKLYIDRSGYVCFLFESGEIGGL